MIDAGDVLSILPTAFDVVHQIAGAVSPRARTVSGFAEQIVTFVLKAEKDGLSQESVLQGVGDLYVRLLEELKVGDSG